MISYHGYRERELIEHENFYAAQVDFYIDEHNNLFVHGGFSSVAGVSADADPKEYWWDRSLWASAVHMKRKYDQRGALRADLPKRLGLYNEIFVGHTITAQWKRKLGFFEDGGPVGSQITTPMNACNVWNLDTGAGSNFKVTVMDRDSKEYWQSDLIE